MKQKLPNLLKDTDQGLALHSPREASNPWFSRARKTQAVTMMTLADVLLGEARFVFSTVRHPNNPRRHPLPCPRLGREGKFQ